LGKERAGREEHVMKEMPITHQGVVYPWQCDHVGHMNVTWYVGKFEADFDDD
jgi:hypothetical protein